MPDTGFKSNPNPGDESDPSGTLTDYLDITAQDTGFQKTFRPPSGTLPLLPLLIAGGLFGGGGPGQPPDSPDFPGKDAPTDAPIGEDDPTSDSQDGFWAVLKKLGINPLELALLGLGILGSGFGGGGGSGGSGGAGKLINGRPESWGPAPKYTGPGTLPPWQGQAHTPQYLGFQPGNSLKNNSTFVQGIPSRFSSWHRP